MLTHFVNILLPLPLPTIFTYRVPYNLDNQIQIGARVVVHFGKNKLYAGLVMLMHTDAPSFPNVKYVIDIVDTAPIVTEKQVELWDWLADYYLCHKGEVMAAAMPSGLKLAGETLIMLHPNFDGEISTLTERELKITEALSYRQHITVAEMQKIVGIQKIFPVIKSLVEKKVILTTEEIKNPYRAKKESYIFLHDDYLSDESALFELLDRLSASKKTEKQTQLLLAFLMLKKAENSVKRAELLKKSECSLSSLQTLINNNVLVQKELQSSRLRDVFSVSEISEIKLSQVQQQSFLQIKELFKHFSVVLLHGITGCGKTEIYMKMIDEVLAQGKQVLYLLPEIALTSQIVNRLQKYFGKRVGVYHSRFNEFERVEIWNRVLQHNDSSVYGSSARGSAEACSAEACSAEAEPQLNYRYSLILGARSALLLPYKNLGLIIVDEEHDASYKQNDPAPRYNARDAAVMLGKLHHAPVLLGTATPSLETYYNVKQGKYGLVELFQRYADSQLPEIWIENVPEARRQKKMEGDLSHFLIDNMRAALERKEQVILFQNRRGYAVRMYCNTCQTMPHCIHCDVTLTYHKKSNLLKCHYCGYAIAVPDQCPNCQSVDVEMKGFGTEKIEETLIQLFPDAKIARMDLDTTRSKSSYQKIISDFEKQHTNILVGTQMVTKGLDFDRVSVVGILEADNMLTFPDFRAFERAFQVMAQVSGRAGRKEVKGKVIIQSYQPWHPALKYVIGNDYIAMYENQIEERKKYRYPPAYRMIKITLKHNDLELVNKAAAEIATELKKSFPKQVLGPEFPLIVRLQNQYLKEIWIKFAKNYMLKKKKELLQKIITIFQTHSKFKQVRVVVNVDC
ncbi:MAG: primosomal protein N' [Bacteroidales bacterium]|jgi:primosomal protein N' (replication factor Y)|nr:primosomal protein N' [Bacteroidales bacterium]